ncbi:MAG: 50S ribosomal protein L29 [Acidobacteriota bacterium]
MRVNDLREFSSEELINKYKELKDQLFKLRVQKTIGQLENPMKIREIKRTIARILTILNEREKGIDQK